MANTFNLGNGNWAQKTEKLLAYNAENDNYKPLPFDFDRASTATRVNKQGLIETVGTDEPRIDFLNDSKGALLLEPSRSNLLTYSEELSNWSNIQNVTVTDNQIISPDGTLNASKINETVDNSVHRLFLNPTVASAKHTYSVFVKKGTRSWIYLRLDGASAEQRTWFDVENGVIGTINSDHNASIEDYGNGWYRCAVSIKGTTYDTTPLAILAITKGNNVQDYAGDVNEYIYAWGAMLEQGSYPTSIIKTQGSAVTRSADTCSGAGNSNVINSTEGVLYAEIAALDDDGTGRNLGISDGTTSNRILILYSSNSNELRFYLEGSGGSITVNHTLTEVTEFIKVAVKYKAQDFSFYVNGVEVNTNPSNITFSGLDDLSFNNPYGGGTSNFYGKTKEIRVYNTALTDAELIALTS